jgi:hypothetical protein
MVRSEPEMVDSAVVRARRASPRMGLVLLAASAVLSGSAAALLVSRHRLWAGAAAAGSAAALLLAGGVWRVGTSGRRSRFAYFVLDLALDTCILAPLAWVYRPSSGRVAVLALVGLGAVMVASYERARGVALGFDGEESFAYRVIRAVLLVFGLVTGWVEAALWAYVAVTVVTGVFRAWNVADQHRARPRSGSA